MSKKILGMALALLTFAGACTSDIGRQTHNRLTPQEKADGWQLLFDGSTTNGWRNFRASSVRPEWAVVDGALTLTREGGGYLVTDATFDSFELSLEWKIAPGGNSGIFYHVVEEGPAPSFTGPEYQLLDNSGSSEPPIEQAAALFGLYAPSVDATRPAGEYNQTRIIVVGDRVEHWLNGIKVVEYNLGSQEFSQRVANSKFAPTGRYETELARFARTGNGHIALQDHGNRVSFRNIKIRRLEAP